MYRYIRQYLACLKDGLAENNEVWPHTCLRHREALLPKSFQVLREVTAQLCWPPTVFRSGLFHQVLIFLDSGGRLQKHERTISDIY